jgi:hypothetical protein
MIYQKYLYNLDKFKNYISFLLFFCTTLDNYFIVEYDAAILPIVSCVFFILLNINLKSLKFENNFYLVLLILFLYNFFGILKNFDSLFSKISHFFLVFLFLITIYQIQKSNLKFIIGMIKFTIILHSFFFFIQFFHYYITKEYLDYIKFFSSYESRYLINYGSILPVRFSGLYAESGTFYSYIFTLFAIGFILEKKLFFFILFSIFFFLAVISHSTFGFILALLVFIFILLKANKNKFFYLCIFLIIFFFIFFSSTSLIFNFLRLFELTDQIAHSDVARADTLLSRFRVLYSYFNNIYFFIYGAKNETLLIAAEDNSLFFSAFIFGGFSLFLASLILFYKTFKKHNFFLVCVIFLAKLSWSYFFLWFALVACILKNAKK